MVMPFILLIRDALHNCNCSSLIWATPIIRLTGHQHPAQLTATSSQINKADYVYNPVGNRTSLTDRRGSQTFGYDQLDRLIIASHTWLPDAQALVS